MNCTPPLIRFLLAGAACLAFTLSTPAQAQTVWTGNLSNDWNTAGNWTGGVPNSASPGNNPVTIDENGANVTMSAAGSSRNLTVSGNGVTAPVLNITENLNNTFSPVSVGSNSTGSNYGGTINHTSGTLTIGGGSGTRRLNIAASKSPASAGTGNTGSYFFGGDSASAPTLSVTQTIIMGARVGETGLLSLSNHGTFSAGGMLMSNSNGVSTFEVRGGDLGISFTDSVTMSAAGGGSSAINATLTSSGFSTIMIDGGLQLDNGVGSGNNTAFNLALDGYSGAVNDVITIIDATSAFTGFGEFGNVTDGEILTIDGYEFEADYNTTDFTFSLQVISVPEPTSASLLVAASMLVWTRRRRR